MLDAFSDPSLDYNPVTKDEHPHVADLHDSNNWDTCLEDQPHLAFQDNDHETMDLDNTLIHDNHIDDWWMDRDHALGTDEAFVHNCNHYSPHDQKHAHATFVHPDKRQNLSQLQPRAYLEKKEVEDTMRPLIQEELHHVSDGCVRNRMNTADIGARPFGSGRLGGSY